MMLRKIRVFLGIFLCLSIFLTATDYSSAAKKNGGNKIVLKQKKKTLKVGQSFRIKIKKSKGIIMKQLKFTTKSSKVKVTKKGMVTAKKQELPQSIAS